MIVLGADMHKRSHTIAAVSAATGEMAGEKTIEVGARGFAAALDWARGLGGERVWALEDCRHVSGALERFLLVRGERVVRVAARLTASERRNGRDRGKSDRIDAIAVARAALREGLDRLPIAELAGVELDIRLLIDHRERLVRMRVALYNDLLWHLHDLWPELALPGCALLRLRDQTGAPVDAAALEGRPYIVSFVYTRCPDVCPLIGQEIGEALRLMGPGATRASALLVSVDPRHDTRAAAQRWLRLHRLPDEARYLLGSAETLLPIWRDWYVVPATGGTAFAPTTHDASVWLVDASGRLRGRWAGGEAIPPADIAHDLGILLDEARRP